MKRFTGEVFYSVIKGKLTARAEFFDEREGKRRQVWRTVTTTKKDAKERVITAVEKILNDDRANPKDYTFAEFAEYYKENHAVPAKFVEGVRVKGKKTWKTIRIDIDRLTEFFGKKKIREIKHDHILKFREKRLETPVKITYFEKVLITDEEREKLKVNPRKKFKRVKREKVSARAIASVNHELRTFSAMMHVAFKNEWLDRLPNMQGIIESAAEAKRERIPTPEEFSRILEEIPKEPRRWHLRAFVLLIADCGARPTEIFQLKFSEIDFVERFVTFTSDKGRRRTKRKIYLTERLYNELLTLPRTNEYVLGGIKSVKKSWNNIVDKLGYKGLTPYNLRHLFVSRLEAFGLSDFLKMRLSGHQTLKMSDRYTHFSDEVLKAVAEKLDENPYITDTIQ